MWLLIKDFFIFERAAFFDPLHPLHKRRKNQAAAILYASLALMAVTAFGVSRLPDADVKKLTVNIPLNEILSDQLKLIEDHTDTYVTEGILRRGETIPALLQRLSITDKEAIRFIRSDKEAKAFFKILPGQNIRASIDKNGKLLSLFANLSTQSNKTEQVSIKRQENNFFSTAREKIENEVHWKMRSGVIKKNFFTSMDDAKVPGPIILQMVKIFGSDIDFRRDIRLGDRFRIIYENFTHEGKKIGYGRVLAVELVTSGKSHQALWYEPSQGIAGYYTFDGRSLQQAFLRNPVEFSRLTSGFGSRVHPILNYRQEHKGIDLAAPRGTRVFSSGNGTIEFIGRKKGYGNLIIIRHPNSYFTYYAHLNNFKSGLKRGTPLSQGDIIGYVGSTGYATGPHLHYEVRYRNQSMNPLDAIFASTPPLQGPKLRAFSEYADALLERIDLIRTVQVASLD